MSNILITGMSAAHTSQNANSRSIAYAGVIQRVLESAGHSVTMVEPDMLWTREYLERYDVVLAGISPITSLSANHAYGALHAIDLMWDSDKLVLFIDAPRPSQITASLRSVVTTRSNLVKPFYSARKGYAAATLPENEGRLHLICEKLLEDYWPKAIYPSLPWRAVGSVMDELPLQGASSLYGINLDAFLISDMPPAVHERSSFWVADNATSTWTKKLAPTLANPIIPMKLNKGWTDAQVQQQMSISLGALIEPHRDGTWWSYRYVQAMNTGTPIATEWRESGHIGYAWEMLASGIESMDPDYRLDLSWNQTGEYLQKIPNKQQGLADLEDTIGLTPMKGQQ